MPASIRFLPRTAVLLPVLLSSMLSLQACATPQSTDPETPVNPTTPSPQTPGPAAPAGSFVLQPGGEKSIAGAGTLRYERVVSDSRCPPDKQCVWAGDAIVAFTWTPEDGAPANFELHTGLEPRSHAVDRHRVVLESLARGSAPAATLRVEPAG